MFLILDYDYDHDDNDKIIFVILEFIIDVIECQNFIFVDNVLKKIQYLICKTKKSYFIM